MNETIRIWNRAEKREEIEQVYGGAWVNWLYGTRSGHALADSILCRPFLSKAYGEYQGSPLSRHKIEPFIEAFKIKMSEYEPGPFRSFNEFFIRRFRPGARSFVKESDRLPAFAEARYVAYEKIVSEQTFPVKGAYLTAAAILGGEEKAKGFEGGPLVIARLCPTDYHRYHYPDSGRTLEEFPVHGKLHSVNPAALRARSDIFATNERHVSILQTENFGKLAYVEVGALCVGRIIQSHPSDRPFQRGDEKGYFLFGGSTVIVLGEPGAWKPDSDLLAETTRGRECFVRLGEAIGLKAGRAI